VKKSDKGNQLKNFARYSTIGIQMLAIIVGGNYLGEYLDQKNGYTEPFYQKWVGLIAVFLAITSVIWQIIKASKTK